MSPLTTARIQTFKDAIVSHHPFSDQESSPWYSTYQHHQDALALLLPSAFSPQKVDNDTPGSIRPLLPFTARFYAIPLASVKAWLTQDAFDLSHATDTSLKALKILTMRSKEIRCAANSRIVSQYLSCDDSPATRSQALTLRMASSAATQTTYSNPDLVGIAVDLFLRTPEGRALRKEIAARVEEMLSFPGRRLDEDAQSVLEAVASGAVEHNYGQLVQFGRFVRHGPHALALTCVVMELQGNALGRVENFERMRGVAVRIWGMRGDGKIEEAL